jgi:hypothetical protein
LKKYFSFALLLILLCSSVTLALTEHSGKYLDYKYTYTYKNNQYIFMFRPTPLPRNDGIAIGAMFEAIQCVDGKHQLVDLNYHLKTGKGGANIIYFIGKKYLYNFLIFKNDNGTVHSFSMWKEYK